MGASLIACGTRWHPTGLAAFSQAYVFNVLIIHYSLLIIHLPGHRTAVSVIMRATQQLAEKAHHAHHHDARSTPRTD
jgi:hypothetical protein